MIHPTRSLLAAALSASLALAQGGLTAYPPSVTLDSGLDAHRLVIVSSDRQGITIDVTKAAGVAFSKPGVAAWRGGALLPLGDGETVATVRHEGRRATVTVTVRGADIQPPVSFRNDVIPVLTRSGCNSGACHGAAAGKNGFGLTLFGYDPTKDLRALSRDYRGRRLDCAAPEQSLMLTKPTGEVRHKGGKRFERDSQMWETLRACDAEVAKRAKEAPGGNGGWYLPWAAAWGIFKSCFPQSGWHLARPKGGRDGSVVFEKFPASVDAWAAHLARGAFAEAKAKKGSKKGFGAI